MATAKKEAPEETVAEPLELVHLDKRELNALSDGLADVVRNMPGSDVRAAAQRVLNRLLELKAR